MFLLQIPTVLYHLEPAISEAGQGAQVNLFGGEGRRHEGVHVLEHTLDVSPPGFQPIVFQVAGHFFNQHLREPAPPIAGRADAAAVLPVVVDQVHGRARKIEVVEREDHRYAEPGRDLR